MIDKKKKWFIGAIICIFNNKLKNILLKKNHMKKWTKDLKLFIVLLWNNSIGSFVCIHAQLHNIIFKVNKQKMFCKKQWNFNAEYNFSKYCKNK
jgi:hypothetical protein